MNMDKSTFFITWNALEDWSYKTKKLYEVGIDSARYDKILYNIVIDLLSLHFDSEQIDFIVWSIFDDNRQLPIGEEQTITINSAELCWEYLNKFKNQPIENHEIPS